ncbi:MAG: ribosomal protein S18-alanine N-acetyltransferase [Lachnospiraceae bacterium]|jgi:ribosomal-protein-alanine N-acetyltransferase|nr:ribosomal protein S18-alanine N-acetyltransferase [Lachnospiraceae bacterium]
MAVAIRRMEKRDIAEAVEIERECFSEPWSVADYNETLLLPYAFYYVAQEEGGHILGIMGLRNVAGEGEITNVAVRPVFRRQGIAAGLMKRLLADGRALGIRDFTLEVRKGNAPAIALYERYGFRAEGMRPGFYEKPKEDCLILWLRGSRDGE